MYQNLEKDQALYDFNLHNEYLKLFFVENICIEDPFGWFSATAKILHI